MESKVRSLQDIKREYAAKKIAAAQGKGIMNACVVMPVYDEDGNQTVETGIISPNGSGEWCAVNVVSVSNSFSDNGFMNSSYRSALIRMRTTSNTFKAGEILQGKICVVESTTPSNPNNIMQDLKYLNRQLAGNGTDDMGYPCMSNGEPIYRRQFFTDDLTRKDSTIECDNMEELTDKLAELKALALKPGAGMDAAKAKAALQTELDSINAIPANKRTAVQKARRTELEEQLA